MATDLMTAKEWQYFKFGKDLKLHPVDCGGDFVCDKGSVTEEGLETLIMLNLGELFPQWPLILSEKYMAGWAGPDIEAGDPTGCHHVFEVKYGAPTQDVIDQVMAYGLCAPRNQNKKWFYNQNSIEPEAIVSTRLAGFWSRRRVQTVAKNPGHTLDEKCEGLIRELTNDLSDLGFTTLFLPAEDVPPCRHRIPCDVLRVHAFEDRVDGLSKRGHGGRANGLELGLEGVEEVLDRAAFG